MADGQPAQAEFDLGNGSRVLISRELASKLHLKGVGREVGGGIGGAVKRDLVTLNTLRLAGCSFHQVTAAIDDQPNAAPLNIGTSILKYLPRDHRLPRPCRLAARARLSAQLTAKDRFSTQR